MRRVLWISLIVNVTATATAGAATFERTRIAPDMGLDALTRGVARQQVGRDLFADPYATVTMGNVDVYDVFPYVESRTFQFVSDPGWSRIVFGEPGRSLRAFDGKGTTLGPLSNPRGLAVDDQNRLYVADTGNNRIVVLQASTKFGDVELAPVFEIDGLSRPYDVAWSDGGTPFEASDDELYVADTGKNEVLAFALTGSAARQVASIGDLGSGPGHFAGPMALTVGRRDGHSTKDVYVADAHTQRLVHLVRQGSSFAWSGDVPANADVVTSLDTDQWGNVYAAAPNRGVVRKLSPDLSNVAELHGELSRPRSFHVPFFNVRDHRDGTTTRVGQPEGLSIEQWSDDSGVRLWSLGLEVADLGVTGASDGSVAFTLTDHAKVSLDLEDAATGRALSHRDLGALDAGAHVLALTDAERRAGASDVVLRVSAASTYPGGTTATARTAFRLAGGAALLPSQAVMLGSWPNPVSDRARIAFVLPGATSRATLKLYDAQGRAVRSFTSPFAAGRNEIAWDRRDDAGGRVAAGVYFARLQADGRSLVQRLVVVR